jgi:quercetin dioxygenase-like cupin family protein
MSCVYNGRQTHTPHTHNEDESFYIIQGPVNFHIDGEERILNTGDFVYTPSGTHHNIQRTNDIDTIKYLVIKRETVEAVDKPYVTSRPYTQNDCYNYAANHPEWSKRTEAADICLLDKNFAAGFRVTLERIVDNNDVKSREFPDEHGQVAIYVLEGEAEVTLNGQHALIGADNTFYCPKNSSFSLQKRGSAPFEYLAITTE